MRQVLVICIALLWAHGILVARSQGWSANFKRDFHATWGQDHVHTYDNGYSTTLVLDSKSGAEITSNRQFLFGRYDLQIKLTKGKSTAGVVTYKLASSGANRDEIHYEFLPDKNGYYLKTKIYINGQVYVEKNTKLTFDPTAGFNKYSIIWNADHVVFKVKGKTISIFETHGSLRDGTKPMNLQASIYYKDGKKASEMKAEILNKHIDWPKFPNSVSFKDFKIDACVADQVRNAKECKKYTLSDD